MKMTFTRIHTEEVTAEVIRETWQAKIEDAWDGPAWKSEEYPTKEAMLEAIRTHDASEVDRIAELLTYQPRRDTLDGVTDIYSDDFYGHRVYHRYYFD